jgi:heme exporter protein CcmD
MNLTEYLSMNGYGPYVWGAVGVCLGAIAFEVASLWSRTRTAQRAMESAGEGARALAAQGEGRPA